MRHASLKVLCLAALFALGSVPAQAGQLFPPENQRTGGSCTDGQVLGWSGDSVKCTNPTPGVNISCPAGQVLRQVVNGVPTCIAPMTVSANSSSHKNDFDIECSVSCPKDRSVVSGGCQVWGNGWPSIYGSMPSGNGWYCIAHTAPGYPNESYILHCSAICQ